jgi:hypothetical protein
MLNAFEDLRIAVLCSRRAPGLDALLRYPHRGSLYDIACLIRTEDVHLVSSELDAGPLLALSEAYPVAPFAHEAVADGQFDIVRAYAYAHREWIIRNSWGPLLVRTVENFACGRLEAEPLVSSQ